VVGFFIAGHIYLRFILYRPNNILAWLPITIFHFSVPKSLARLAKKFFFNCRYLTIYIGFRNMKCGKIVTCDILHFKSDYWISSTPLVCQLGKCQILQWSSRKQTLLWGVRVLWLVICWVKNILFNPEVPQLLFQVRSQLYCLPVFLWYWSTSTPRLLELDLDVWQ